MLLAHMHTMFEYHYWANERIFEFAERLDDAQQTATTSFPFGSVKRTLAHLLMADTIWRKRLQGESPDREWFDAFMHERETGSFDMLRKGFAREMVAMQGYLDTLDEAVLVEDFSYSNSTGTMFTQERVSALTHVLLHGMQHRSELAQMLTDLGHSPGDIDYFVWVRRA